MSNKLVLIPLEEYKELLNAQAKLKALDCGGVDNWDWYSDSMENYEEPEIDPSMIIHADDKEALHFRRVINKNMAQCLKCKDVIESRDRHHLQYCSCRSLFVDGGPEYLRRGGNLDKMKELSTYKFVTYSTNED